MSSTFTGTIYPSISLTSQNGQVFPESSNFPDVENYQGSFVEVTSLPTGASVDNIFYFNGSSAGNYFKRVIDGPIRAAQCGIFGTGSDMRNALNTAVNHPDIKEIVFDYPGGADITINSPGSPVSVPADVVLRFEAGNKLIGTGVINGGIIDAGYRDQIFATTLTINPAGLATEMFSVMWFGAKGDGSTDDQPAIQKTVDTVVASYFSNKQRLKKIYLPEADYAINKPIMLYSFGTDYGPVNLHLIGDADFWETSGTGTRILPQFKDTFAIGVQIGKGVRIKGLYIIGGFTPPSLTSQQFYQTDFASFVDVTCRDSNYSPYSGIVIDPFSLSNSDMPGDGGYPGFNGGGGSTNWYRGTGGTGGSTNVVIEECFISNFVVGVCSSPNSFTRNAELTLIRNTQFANMKLCISSSHDQEKDNKVENSACWANSHTFFASHYYGAGLAGQWELNTINIAGRVNTFMHHDTGGYFPSYVRYVFTESLGKWGIFNSSVGSRVECCEIGFALPATDTGCYFSRQIESTGVTFENCNIRFYQAPPETPVTLRGGSKYVNCNFTIMPFNGFAPYFLDGQGYSQFIDCTASGQPLGSTQPVWGYVNTSLPVYGNFSLSRRDTIATYTDVSWQFNSPQTNLACLPASTSTITISGTNRQFSFTVSASDLYMFEVGRILLNYTGFYIGPAGIITNVNGGTNTITVSYASEDLINGTYQFAVLYELTFAAPFMGDATAGNSEITNIAMDTLSANPSDNIGKWVRSYCFATNTSIPYVRILSYNGGANKYTTNVAAFRTASTIYFSNAINKIVATEGGNSAIANGEILPVNGKLMTNENGLPVVYSVMKTGFYNAAALSDPRQAIYVMESPYRGVVYKKVTSNYTVQIEDDIILVDASGGAVNIQLQETVIYYNTIVSTAKKVIVKKIDSSANAVHVLENTSFNTEPIDGASSKTLSSQYDFIEIAMGIVTANYPTDVIVSVV